MKRRLSILPLLVACALLAPRPARAFMWPTEAEQIADRLRSGEVDERRRAASQLTDLPRAIATELIRASAADPDAETRLALARAAIHVGMPGAGDLVTPWLGEADVRLRLAACEVIGAEPSARSLEALGRVLGDADARVRKAAADALGESEGASGVTALLGHLDDPIPEVRAAVARSLGRAGDARAIVPLIGKVQDAVPEVRAAVARALGELKDERASGALMLALQDASTAVRIEALVALGAIGSADATLAILALLDATTTGSRGAAARSSAVWGAALGALGRVASPEAIARLIAELPNDPPGEAATPARDALVGAGHAAVPALTAALGRSPSPALAIGAARALAIIAASGPDRADVPVAAEAITRAMQQGSLPQVEALGALAELGSSDALVAVLQLIDDRDPSVRRSAVSAARALLDPTEEDGRAVDPVRAALAHAVPSEVPALLGVLGRTGSPRAQATLLAFARSTSRAPRVAAIVALGVIPSPSADVDRALLEALGADSAELRLAAASALASVGRPALATELTRRLRDAADQDRGGLGIALSGVLARSTDPRAVEQVEGALPTAPGGARDSLIEGLGRMRGAASLKALDALAASSLDDRRKVAEALGGHPEGLGTLRRLLRDVDPGVRAAAAWSLGAVAAGSADARLVEGLLADADIAVSANATAALGRIAARAKAPAAAAPLCSLLADGRPYVRANALVGLTLAGSSCEPAGAAPAVASMLRGDPSAEVRAAAARYLHASLGAGSAPREATARALRRCAAEDRDPLVASACAKLPASSTRSDDLTVFIVPSGAALPERRAAFALVRADGFIRLGNADRRGAAFEHATPRGELRLTVPSPLAR